MSGGGGDCGNPTSGCDRPLLNKNSTSDPKVFCCIRGSVTPPFPTHHNRMVPRLHICRLNMDRSSLFFTGTSKVAPGLRPCSSKSTDWSRRHINFAHAAYLPIESMPAPIRNVIPAIVFPKPLFFALHHEIRHGGLGPLQALEQVNHRSLVPSYSAECPRGSRARN